MRDSLADYVTYLAESGRQYSTIGRYAKAVARFLLSGGECTKAGYRRYVRERADGLSREPLAREALLDFLAWRGVGFRKAKAEPRGRRLERLQSLPDRTARTLGDFARYLAEKGDYSPRTVDSYLFTARDYFRYLADISTEGFRRYVETLEAEGRSPATICLRVTALRQLAAFAGKAIKVRKPRIPRKLSVENIPTEREYRRLLEYLSGNERYGDWYFLVKTLATTGARVSEFRRLTWEDVIGGEVTLRGKGGKYRRLLFPRALREEAREYARERGKSGPVVRSHVTGEAVTDRGINDMLKRFGEACGIAREKMHPHAFRHFFAKMFLARTKDVVQLADLLGHGSVETTRIYLRKSDEEQKREINRSVTW